MTVRIHTHSRGYRTLRVDGEDLPDEVDGPRYLMTHRLVLYAEGRLSSPSILGDGRETHHIDGSKSLNGSENLDPLLPAEHGRTTRAEQGADEQDEEVVEVRYSSCPSCSTGTPQEVREDGSRRCVICRTVVDVPEVEQDDGRVEA